MIVLITATQAREPLVRGEWLNAGQHIIAMGADDQPNANSTQLP